MLQPGVLPCAEALPAFVALHDLSLRLHVDKLGKIHFPSASGRVGAHLHLVGGVHFNLVAKGDNRPDNSPVASVSSKTIYMLQNDSEDNAITVMQIRSRPEKATEEPKFDETATDANPSTVTDHEPVKIVELTHSDLDFRELRVY
jgi:hypothetical protein